MDLIEFKNLPDRTTPLNAENLNHNFNELEDAINTIVESGSNVNGNWIKFADGTMIQTGAISLTSQDTRIQGGLTYYSAAEIITLPQPFINDNYCGFSNILLANMNYFGQSYIAPISNTQVTVSYAITTKGETRTVQWFIIGKWK